jgi:type VII secretion protein EccE
MLLLWDYWRRGSVRLVRDDDYRLAALRGLMPDLAVRTAEGPGDGGPVGVARDGSGWFAAVAVLPPEGLRGESQAPVPLDELARLVIGMEQPGLVLQVLTQTVPAPAPVAGLGARCATSYLELMREGGEVACDRSTWVALRLNTRGVATASVGSSVGEEDMQALAAALIRRIGKRLRRVGLAAKVLTADGLLDALSRSCDLTHQDGGIRAREGWDAWHSMSMSHACFWVRSWPSLAESGALLMRLAGVPAGMTSVAMVLEPHQEGIELRCLIRLSAPRELLAQACRQMVAIAEQAGAKLFRLNGEQAPAVYATAPINRAGLERSQSEAIRWIRVHRRQPVLRGRPVQCLVRCHRPSSPLKPVSPISPVGRAGPARQCSTLVSPVMLSPLPGSRRPACPRRGARWRR